MLYGVYIFLSFFLCLFYDPRLRHFTFYESSQLVAHIFKYPSNALYPAMRAIVRVG